MDFLRRAEEISEDIIHDRRFLHENAETGLDMPVATDYVRKKLLSFGITPKKCGHGISAVAGTGSPVILLRADMDALEMREESNEEFSCKNGNMHSCGHDMHCAMLLAAARMLKECERSLAGTVKFMFQPAEETFEGSEDMIKGGILEDPQVDAAFAVHVMPGNIPQGYIAYNSRGVMMASADVFRIDITGRGSHGAYPHYSADPVMSGVYIYQALQGMMASKADAQKMSVMSVGQFHGGSEANAISGSAFMEGTLRTNDKTESERLKKNAEEIVKTAGGMYGAEAEIKYISSVPALVCDGKLADDMIRYISMMNIAGFDAVNDISANASEDFARICEKVPGAMIYLSAGFEDDSAAYPAHNPKVRFNEQCLKTGSAIYAHCAKMWLEENRGK